MYNKLLALIFCIAGCSALAGPPRNPPNIAVGIDAPGAARARVQVRGPDLKEPLSYDFKSANGEISGGIYAPPGKSQIISITAFDANGETMYSGETKAIIDSKLTLPFEISLSGRPTKDALGATLGTYRFALGLAAGESAGGFLIEATLLDAAGKHVAFEPKEVGWRVPGFEVLPYSCFRNSLCIELPDISGYADILACWRDVWCSHRTPPDTRGPYRYVTVGTNHTCALTIDDDAKCWGDNVLGELGTTAPVCFPSDPKRQCSLVPLPVTCPAGESCKFRSIAAGGDHTCAIDSNGKAWCWGDNQNQATGTFVTNLPISTPLHRQITAFTAVGAAVQFVAIDTNAFHTCALSSTQDVWCWGNNFSSQLGVSSAFLSGTSSATLVLSGNKYKSVKTGFLHTCAIQVNGLLDCWGDNTNRALTGTVNPAKFITVNSKIPLLRGRGVSMVAAGSTTSCAQNADNELVCWGSVSLGSPIHSAGAIVLKPAEATSFDTEMACQGPFCARTCATDFGGDLLCADWLASTTSGASPPPPKLTAKPDPQSDHAVNWQQVDVGTNHVCGVTTQRDVWCFGLNSFGQFGTGVMSSMDTTAAVLPANR